MQSCILLTRKQNGNRLSPAGEFYFAALRRLVDKRRQFRSCLGNGVFTRHSSSVHCDVQISKARARNHTLISKAGVAWYYQHVKRNTTKTISLKVPDSLLEAVDREAQRRTWSRSEVVREAMAVYTSPRKGREENTVGSFMGDLMETIERTTSSAPRDLSTNKAYLEEMGHDATSHRRHRPARRPTKSAR